jgi:hypothetical protein
MAAERGSSFETPRKRAAPQDDVVLVYRNEEFRFNVEIKQPPTSLPAALN